MSSQDHQNLLQELFQLNFPTHGEGDESYTINADTFHVQQHQCAGWKQQTP